MDSSEGAFLRGNRPTVAAAACATRPLRPVGVELSAGQIHHAALATVADRYGVVVPTASDLGCGSGGVSRRPDAARQSSSPSGSRWMPGRYSSSSPGANRDMPTTCQNSPATSPSYL